MTRPRHPKPTPRGLEMLRILLAAWERRDKARGNWRGSVWVSTLRDRRPFGLFRSPAKHGHAERIAQGLEARGLVRRCGYFNAYQITPAGRRAVERAKEEAK